MCIRDSRRTPLRATERAGFLSACVREPRQTRDQFNCACVVESLKRLKQWLVDSEGSGECSEAAASCVEVRSHVDKQIRARTIAGLSLIHISEPTRLLS